MKRVVLGLVAVATAAALAPPAAADLCVYDRTPYPVVCIPDVSA